MSEKKFFLASKELLTSSEILVHYNPRLNMFLACDASSFDIGAVLAHHMLDDSERPIDMHLVPCPRLKKKYSQLECDGLACVFGIKQFHRYLFGHSFDLIMDHKPLMALLNQHKSTSAQGSGRIRPWALFLSTYEQIASPRCSNSSTKPSRVTLAYGPSKGFFGYCKTHLLVDLD